MVDDADLLGLLSAAAHARTKVGLVGDRHQLDAIGPGGGTELWGHGTQRRARAHPLTTGSPVPAPAPCPRALREGREAERGKTVTFDESRQNHGPHRGGRPASRTWARRMRAPGPRQPRRRRSPPQPAHAAHHHGPHRDHRGRHVPVATHEAHHGHDRHRATARSVPAHDGTDGGRLAPPAATRALRSQPATCRRSDGRGKEPRSINSTLPPWALVSMTNTPEGATTTR
ncbi:MAG: AAA family ATPase [Acidimicrobiales bacterium]